MTRDRVDLVLARRGRSKGTKFRVGDMGIGIESPRFVNSGDVDCANWGDFGRSLGEIGCCDGATAFFEVVGFL